MVAVIRRTKKRWLAALLGAALSASLIAGCGRDPGDPAAITRAFVAALMSADIARVEALTCGEWQTTTTRWASAGTSGLRVDADHLVLEVEVRGEVLAEVRVTGALTLRTPDGQREVRSLDGVDAMLFTLIDEDGWKVCGLEGAPPE